MHEKQPNRNIEKVEYLDESVVNEKLRPAVNKTSISFITDKKLSQYVLLLLLFFLRIQQSLVNKMFSFHAKTANAQHLYRAKCSFFPNCRQILCITIFELLGTSSQSSLFNVPLYQISVNLENFSFWDQIFPKKTLGWSIKTNSTWE